MGSFRRLRLFELPGSATGANDHNGPGIRLVLRLGPLRDAELATLRYLWIRRLPVRQRLLVYRRKLASSPGAPAQISASTARDDRIRHDQRSAGRASTTGESGRVRRERPATGYGVR